MSTEQDAPRIDTTRRRQDAGNAVSTRTCFSSDSAAIPFILRGETVSETDENGVTIVNEYSVSENTATCISHRFGPVGGDDPGTPPVGRDAPSAPPGGSQLVATAYTANNLNQYSSISTSDFGLQTLDTYPQYDLDGNMTRHGEWTYAYDSDNRLVSIASDGISFGKQSFQTTVRWRLTTIRYHWGKDLSGTLHRKLQMKNCRNEVTQ